MAKPQLLMPPDPRSRKRQEEEFITSFVRVAVLIAPISNPLRAATESQSNFDYFIEIR
jgi:hypothetical protein